ncbi:MAG: pyridoxal-phosphate dependent enzyme, partial [Sphingomonadales bacterium]
SFKAGRRVANEAGAASICDAMLVPMPGELTFAVNKQYVSGGVSVSDDEICRAMRFAASYLNLVIEPSGAVALAAVLAGKIPTEGRRIGLIATGGNVDMETFCQIISDG